MRFTVSIFGLLVFPFVVGCEGNTPRRSPLAPTSVPTSAKTVEFTTPTNSPGPGGQQSGNVHVEKAGNPDVPAPTTNTPITIDADQLETRRQLLNYHTAIFLKEEVGKLSTTGITENNNFIYRPFEGLQKNQIIPLIYGQKAETGKPPQTVAELRKLVGDFLTELKPNEFYVYEPKEVTEENKPEMLFLQQYP